MQPCFNNLILAERKKKHCINVDPFVDSDRFPMLGYTLLSPNFSISQPSLTC